MCCRLGEASNPGPPFDSGPQIGCFNPGGIAGKSHLISLLPATASQTVWAVSESHLTREGQHKFSQELSAHTNYCMQMGTPVPARSTTFTAIGGKHRGVGFLSNAPSRTMMNDWDQNIRDLNRLHTACFQFHKRPVLGGVVYGYAVQPETVQTRQQTDNLCQHVTDAIVQGQKGLRFIAGDFNQSDGALPSMEQWANLGWVNVQKWAYDVLGQEIQPTCKGSTTRDHLFVSPELSAYLTNVEVQQDWFADHAILFARFSDFGDPPRIPLWRTPKPLPWKECSKLPDSVDHSHHATDPTMRYREICQQLEQRVVQQLAKKDVHVTDSFLGRGQTHEVHFVPEFAQPPKQARAGEPQPAYFGSNLKHAQWIRQVRRLDNLAKSLQKNALDTQKVEHRSNLWRSILTAPGFQPNFPLWWSQQKHPQLPVLPDYLPSHACVDVVRVAMQEQLRMMEKMLNRSRVQAARNRRKDDPNIIFRDLKGPRPAPVQMLLQQTQAVVTYIDVADMAVEVHPPQSWTNDMIRVGSSLLQPIHVEPDKLWLPHLDGIQVGHSVLQSAHLGTLQQLFDAFATEWKKRWDRHADVPDARWQPILDFATTAMPALPPMPYTKITYERWIAAVKKKPQRAATGPDSMSRLDLLNMPRDLAEQLIELLHQVEQTGTWPTQLLDGFVVALEKQPNSSFVHQFRPISIFAVTYRVWSSLRASEILAHIGPHLPDTCTGNLPGRSTSDQWLGIMQEIEHSMTTDTPLCGGVLDLVKAFNTLPRVPLLTVLAQLQVPSPILRAWGAALTGMKRRFRIRQAIGPPNASCTGYAEGCALSCIAMLTTNLICHQWCKLRFPRITCWSYVDNLEIVAPDPATLAEGMQGMRQFCQLLDVSIDDEKTYTWAVNNADRKALREDKFNTRLHEKDLGAHMQFCRLVTNYTVTRKCKGLAPLWSRLARSLSAYHNKLRALRCKAWPSCLHTVSAVHLADRHFASLRTGAMKALGEHKRGTSPIVHMSLLEPPHNDPQCFALLSTVLTYRMVGKGVEHFATMMQFLHTSATAGHLTPGPLSVLLNRLQQVAWQWHSGSVFLDQWNLPCDVLHCPIQELKQRLMGAWQARVQAQASERKTMHGLQLASPILTTMDLHKLSHEDQAVMRAALNGTFFTADKHYDGQVKLDDMCQHCGAPDSQVHRHWQCPAFADCRDLHSDQIATILSMPKCVSAHGWMPSPPSAQQFHHARMSQVDLLDDFHVFSSMPPFLHLFTDGACIAPTCRISRLAAWGVVVAHEDFSTFVPVASGFVVGWIHTVLRAELHAAISAIMFAMHACRPCALWIDNDLVFKRLRRCLQGAMWVKPNQKDADLWRLLYQVMHAAGPLVRSVHKVMSHQRPTGNEAEDWVFSGNAAADSLASHVFQQSCPLMHTWFQLQADLEHLACFRRQVHKVILAVGRKAITSKASPSTHDKPPPPPRLQPSQIREVQIPTIVSEDLPRRYIFPGCDIVLNWLNHLISSDQEPTVVSWFELNLLFEHRTGAKGVTYSKRRKQWLHHSAAELGDFARRTNHLSRYIQGCVTQSGGSCKAYNMLSASPHITFWCQGVFIRLTTEDTALINSLLQAQQPRFTCVAAFRSIG